MLEVGNILGKAVGLVVHWKAGRLEWVANCTVAADAAGVEHTVVAAVVGTHSIGVK